MGRTMSYVGAAILFLVGLCFVGYGTISVIGSTSASGDPGWLTYGIIFGCIGLVFIGAGAGLIWLGARGHKTEVVQQVTMKVDLPGDTKISQMKCQSCGGVITKNDIQIMAGAPVVSCPYCHSTYQLTEEPKW